MSTHPPDSRSLRRWAPLAALAVVGAVAVAVVVTGGSDGDGTTGTSTVTTSGAGTGRFEPLSYSAAVAAGTADEIDWGDRCDTDRGRLAYPSFFADECYAPFDGDNGGATDRGVTGDTIRIAVYQAPDDDPVLDFVAGAVSVDESNAEIAETLRGFVEFYEAFHETYGRHVELVFVEGGRSEDPVAARATAVRIDEDIDPFMVWGGPVLTSAFAEELAARGIACIGCGGSSAGTFFPDNDPLMWSVGMSGQQGRIHLAEYIGKQLAGGNALFAGDPAMREAPRVFGRLHLEGAEAAASQAAEADLAERLAARGVTFAVTQPYRLDPVTLAEQAAGAVARLKEAGVTTVVFSGDPVAPITFTREATAQEWFPEWVIGNTALVDTTVYGRLYDPDQWAHAFGVTTLAARTLPEVAGSRFLYEWFHGETPPAPDTADLITPAPALFYAVLQAVGPELTHETWRDALFAAEATPRALTAPSLNYGDDTPWGFTDYHGVDDATEIWWDPTAEGPDEIRRDGVGMWRWTDRGRRYPPGEWPERPSRAFDPDDAVAIFTERPPEEAVPDYPPPVSPGG